MKSVRYNGKDLSLVDLASLQDSVMWIAYGHPPVARKYRAFLKKDDDTPQETYERISAARLDLYYKLTRGELKAKGVLCEIILEYPAGYHDDPINLEPYYRVIDADYGNPVDIAADQWEFDNVIWQENALIDQLSALYGQDNNSGYSEIFIPTLDLVKAFPQELTEDNELAGKAVKKMPNTPFIELMLEAIEHFEITDENQVVTKKLVPWFEERLKKMGEKAPNNKAKMMATFVRAPDSQKGGNKRKK